MGMKKKGRKWKEGRKGGRKDQTIMDFLKIHSSNSAIFGDPFSSIWTPQKSFLCEEMEGREEGRNPFSSITE